MFLDLPFVEYLIPKKKRRKNEKILVSFFMDVFFHFFVQKQQQKQMSRLENDDDFSNEILQSCGIWSDETIAFREMETHLGEILIEWERLFKRQGWELNK
jgi:hypothetical protein